MGENDMGAENEHGISRRGFLKLLAAGSIAVGVGGPDVLAQALSQSQVATPVVENTSELAGEQLTTAFLPSYDLTENESKQFADGGDQPMHFTLHKSEQNFGSLLKADSQSGLLKSLTQKSPTGSFDLAGAEKQTTFAGKNIAEFVDNLQTANPGAVEVVFIPFNGEKRFGVPIVRVNKDITVDQTVDGKSQKGTFRNGTFLIPDPTTGEVHMVDQSATPDDQIKIILATQPLSDKMATTSVKDPKDGTVKQIITPTGSPVIVGVDKNDIIQLVITNDIAVTLSEGSNIATPPAQYEVLSEGTVYSTPEPELQALKLTSALKFLGKDKDGHSHKIQVGTNIAGLEFTDLDTSVFQQVLDVYGNVQDCRIEIRDIAHFQDDVNNWLNQGYDVKLLDKSLSPGGKTGLMDTQVTPFTDRNGDRVMPVFFSVSEINRVYAQAYIPLNGVAVELQNEIDAALYANTLKPNSYRPHGEAFFSIAGEALGQELRSIPYIKVAYKVA